VIDMHQPAGQHTLGGPRQLGQWTRLGADRPGAEAPVDDDHAGAGPPARHHLDARDVDALGAQFVDDPLALPVVTDGTDERGRQSQPRDRDRRGGRRPAPGVRDSVGDQALVRVREVVDQRDRIERRGADERHRLIRIHPEPPCEDRHGLMSQR
jgi:hypothetical protein